MGDFSLKWLILADLIACVVLFLRCLKESQSTGDWDDLAIDHCGGLWSQRATVNPPMLTSWEHLKGHLWRHHDYYWDKDQSDGEDGYISRHLIQEKKVDYLIGNRLLHHPQWVSSHFISVAGIP